MVNYFFLILFNSVNCEFEIFLKVFFWWILRIVILWKILVWTILKDIPLRVPVMAHVFANSLLLISQRCFVILRADVDRKDWRWNNWKMRISGRKKGKAERGVGLQLGQTLLFLCRYFFKWLPLKDARNGPIDVRFKKFLGSPKNWFIINYEITINFSWEH